MRIEDRPGYIRSALTEKFTPDVLEIVDDSHRHAGHSSARGGGHFNVYIVSDKFVDQPLIKRHRMVYAALHEALQANEIHALSIKALTPDEHAAKA